MGDGADMALENAWDDVEEFDRFSEGRMSLQEAYESGITDELGCFNLPTLPGIRQGQKKTSCKYCGELGLSWKKTSSGWRLFTKTDEVHECQSHERSKINA